VLKFTRLEQDRLAGGVEAGHEEALMLDIIVFLNDLWNAIAFF
jgi:hypothetical protein